MNKYWKLLIPLLFALAIALGFFQREINPYLAGKKTVYNFAPSDKSLSTYYKEASELAKKTSTDSSVSFLAVGDIMLSRNVAGQIQKSGNANLPFEKMAELLNPPTGGNDFNFGNLESPISPTSPVVGGHSLIFSAPLEYAQSLANYNFKILNLANNHALDQGLKGLKFTTNILDQLKIQHIGVGKNLEEAWQPAVFETNGIKLCFIGASYSSINDGGKATNNYVARIEDIDKLKANISKLKAQCDFIVATMHAGTEYVRNPNKSQIAFAHAAIDAGAGMVIGAHPHWVQTIEKYEGKYIFYSLGNFIFDQMWSQNTREGLTLKINLTKPITPNLQGPKIPAKLKSVELIPIIIDNYSTPRPATPEETKKILEKIGEKETILK